MISRWTSVGTAKPSSTDYVPSSNMDRALNYFFADSTARPALSEVKRRLAAMPPAGHIFEPLPLEGSADLRTMAERLLR